MFEKDDEGSEAPQQVEQNGGVRLREAGLCLSDGNSPLGSGVFAHGVGLNGGRLGAENRLARSISMEAGIPVSGLRIR
ncbi:hypothetical protein HDF17_000057 [Granulicella arctica]|uniref:Uncharacterized protein n=1 Tax=Granulicella arctica TaxID=940613 RepID=A0A7Y9TFM1_9BACT|nr:hypothetical protein [Granulicella arctica]